MRCAQTRATGEWPKSSGFVHGLGSLARPLARAHITTPPRKGSHYKVSHGAMPMILTIPAHRPIKPVYVRDLVRFVDAVRESEG